LVDIHFILLQTLLLCLHGIDCAGDYAFLSLIFIFLPAVWSSFEHYRYFSQSISSIFWCDRCCINENGSWNHYEL